MVKPFGIFLEQSLTNSKRGKKNKICILGANFPLLVNGETAPLFTPATWSLFMFCWWNGRRGKSRIVVKQKVSVQILLFHHAMMSKGEKKLFGVWNSTLVVVISQNGRGRFTNSGFQLWGLFLMTFPQRHFPRSSAPVTLLHRPSLTSPYSPDY